MALITCNNLCLGYDGKTVVKNLNFCVNDGDYLCIIGENGSGKSTLMKTLLGLKKGISGSVQFGEGLKANQIGYLPQQTVVQKDFPASVEEIVLSGCLNQMGTKPFFTKKEKQLAMQNMEKLEITSLAKRCYRELSGGQQQRVLLARALCSAGKILLLDEPVAALDPKVTAEMYSIIHKLNSEDHITIIMISHDLSAAVKYASHILHIGHTPLFFGTKADYVNSNVYKAFTLGEDNSND